jgi:hypothetical protein
MSRVRRSLQRRQFRLSLDPLDPVEGEALKRIDTMVEEAKDLLGTDITQEEAERFAFKRLLLDLLSNRPAELSAPVRAPRQTQEQPAPAVIAPAVPVAPAQPVQRKPEHQEAAPAASVVKEEKSNSAHWADELLESQPKPVNPLLAGLAWKDTDGDN